MSQQKPYLKLVIELYQESNKIGFLLKQDESHIQKTGQEKAFYNLWKAAFAVLSTVKPRIITKKTLASWFDQSAYSQKRTIAKHITGKNIKRYYNLSEWYDNTFYIDGITGYSFYKLVESYGIDGTNPRKMTR